MTESLALGIDIGGTKTAFGIVNRRGEIIAKGSIPTTGHGPIEQYINALREALEPLFTKVGKKNIIGAGAGAPNGNYFTGEIAYAPNMPWHNVIPLAKLLTEALQVKTVINNDAKAAAIGEMTYGAAKGMKNFLLVTLGTGLGSGFVANGEIIYGHDGFAGELGHVIIEHNGRKCGCGRYGCLETYASATGIVRTAELWLEGKKEETILRAHKGNISSQQIHEAALQGDQFALSVFDYTAKVLAMALANAVTITSPQAIILFGGLAKAGNILMNPLRKYFEDSLLNIYQGKIKIIHSAFEGPEAAILGASALAW